MILIDEIDNQFTSGNLGGVVMKELNVTLRDEIVYSPKSDTNYENYQISEEANSVLGSVSNDSTKVPQKESKNEKPRRSVEDKLTIPAIPEGQKIRRRTAYARINVEKKRKVDLPLKLGGHATSGSRSCGKKEPSKRNSFDMDGLRKGNRSSRSSRVEEGYCSPPATKVVTTNKRKHSSDVNQQSQPPPGVTVQEHNRSRSRGRRLTKQSSPKRCGSKLTEHQSQETCRNESEENVGGKKLHQEVLHKGNKVKLISTSHSKAKSKASKSKRPRSKPSTGAGRGRTTVNNSKQKKILPQATKGNWKCSNSCLLYTSDAADE